MGVNAALRGDTEAPHQLHLPVGREIEAGARIAQRGHDRGMRQTLDRVEQLDIRQSRGQPVVLRAQPRGVDEKQRRAVALHQGLDRCARERILRGIEFLRGVRARFSDLGRFGHSSALLRKC